MSTKNLSEQTWPYHLSQRLAYVWQSISHAQNGPVPFKPGKGEEAKAYAAMPSQDRWGWHACMYTEGAGTS